MHLGTMHSVLMKLGLGGDDADRVRVVAITLFASLLCACIVIGHLLEENRWINESITALILGSFTGVIVLANSGGTNSHILRFNEELFFIYLLPPIIFNAGFQVKKKQFFHNFIPIILFGVVGVFISFIIISSGCIFFFPKLGLRTLEFKDYFALGTIFSATDSVCTLQVLNQDETPLLYSLVFGEGVVNDATSVVLYRAIQNFEFSQVDGFKGVLVGLDFLKLLSLSTMLGILVGLLSAYTIRTLYFGRHSTNREIALMALMAYLSYMMAELFYLSGILTVFFCGIVMSHYTWHNVTESSRLTTKHAFATVSFICETFIFLYVGMDVLDMEKWKRTNASVLQTLGICGTLLSTILIGRAAFVFSLSALSNYIRGTDGVKITTRHQIIIWWAGLIRGAVSIALTFNQFTISGSTRNPEHATLIISTMIIVLFTTLVFGMMNKPLMSWLLPHQIHSAVSDTSDPSSPNGSFSSDFQVPLLVGHNADHRPNGHVPTSIGFSMLLHSPTSAVHHWWRSFDDTYMRPVFGGHRLRHQG